MELSQVVSELVAHDKQQVVDALHAGAPSIWQEVFNKGHAVATSATKSERERLEARATTAESERDTARAELVEFGKKRPDEAKIREQYQKEIADMSAKHEREKSDLAGKLNEERAGKVLNDLKARLTSKLDPDYAEIQVAKVRDRIRLTGDGYEVLQEGKDIPYAPASGRSSIDLLADEIIGKAPTKFVSAAVDSGSGTRGADGGGGGNGSGVSSLAQLQKNIVKQRETEAAKATKTGAERMGMIPRV